MSKTPDEKLDDLKQAASEYFNNEIARINAEYDYLDKVFAGRGSAAKLEDVVVYKANSYFVNSLTDYLQS